MPFKEHKHGLAGEVAVAIKKNYVIDFIHLHHWPVFNAADVFVAAEGGLLLRGKDRLKEAT